MQTYHFIQGEEDQLLLPTLQPLYSYRCGKGVIYLIGEFGRNKSAASSLALPIPKTLPSALGCFTAENIYSPLFFQEQVFSTSTEKCVQMGLILGFTSQPVGFLTKSHLSV